MGTIIVYENGGLWIKVRKLKEMLLLLISAKNAILVKVIQIFR